MEIKALPAPATVPLLYDLELGRCDDSISTLVFTSLSMLQLPGRGARLSPRAFAAFVAGCGQLSSLTLARLPWLDNATLLRSLAGSRATVRALQLELDRCPRVSPALLSGLAEAAPALRSLSIDRAQRAAPESLPAELVLGFRGKAAMLDQLYVRLRAAVREAVTAQHPRVRAVCGTFEPLAALAAGE